MTSKSKIEWTERTWNPIGGCTIVSEGCKNCYAMRQAHRNEAMGLKKYEGTTKKTESGRIVWTGKIGFDEKALQEPLKRKKPTMYFVNSMSDLFHEDVPFEFVIKVFAIMEKCKQHTFQILTKRPERMIEFFEFANTHVFSGESMTILNNVWLGVSCEDQKTADERIPLLLECPAAVRFVSAEPLLSEIIFGSYLMYHEVCINCGDGSMYGECCGEVVRVPMPTLDWVIVGGESGPNARPMHPDWARSIRDQCVAAGVPYFFKQWGEWLPQSQILSGDGKTYGWVNIEALTCDFELSSGLRETGYKVGKKHSGRLLDGKVWDQMPEVNL